MFALEKITISLKELSVNQIKIDIGGYPGNNNGETNFGMLLT